MGAVHRCAPKPRRGACGHPCRRTGRSGATPLRPCGRAGRGRPGRLSPRRRPHRQERKSVSVQFLERKSVSGNRCPFSFLRDSQPEKRPKIVTSQPGLAAAVLAWDVFLLSSPLQSNNRDGRLSGKLFHEIGVTWPSQTIPGERLDQVWRTGSAWRPASRTGTVRSRIDAVRRQGLGRSRRRAG